MTIRQLYKRAAIFNDIAKKNGLKQRAVVNLWDNGFLSYSLSTYSEFVECIESEYNPDTAAAILECNKYGRDDPITIRACKFMPYEFDVIARIIIKEYRE